MSRHWRAPAVQRSRCAGSAEQAHRIGSPREPGLDKVDLSPPDASFRVLSWNVNGLRAAAGKGYFAWLEDHDPDVVLLQETKAHAEMLPKELRDVPGWFTRYHAAQRRARFMAAPPVA